MTAEDNVNAEKLFGTLAHITTSQLPQSRLLTMLGDSRLVNTKQGLEQSRLQPTSTKNRIININYRIITPNYPRVLRIPARLF